MANSVSNKDYSSAPSSGQLSPSSLALSMGGYNSINEEMGQTQMSLGNNGNGMKPGLSTWLSPASWVASAPGGPLAEVQKPTVTIWIKEKVQSCIWSLIYLACGLDLLPQVSFDL